MVCGFKRNWNDLKGNTFRFLCTKFTAGASSVTDSSVSVAVLVISLMEQQTVYWKNIRDPSHIPWTFQSRRVGCENIYSAISDSQSCEWISYT